jgi:hypothetical protein
MYRCSKYFNQVEFEEKIEWIYNLKKNKNMKELGFSFDMTESDLKELYSPSQNNEYESL